MRALVGLLLVLVGGAVLLYGVITGLVELVGLYQRTLTDPLGGGTPETEASSRMLRAVTIGAAGAPFFLIGTLMLKSVLFRRRLGRSRG